MFVSSSKTQSKTLERYQWFTFTSLIRNHKKWDPIYDRLSSQWFIEKIQDYGFFEADLTTSEVDAYYLTLIDQVKDLKEEIKDNQELIIQLGTPEKLEKYKELSLKDIIETIKAAFKEAGKGMDESEVMRTFETTMQYASVN